MARIAYRNIEKRYLVKVLDIDDLSVVVEHFPSSADIENEMAFTNSWVIDRDEFDEQFVQDNQPL